MREWPLQPERPERIPIDSVPALRLLELRFGSLTDLAIVSLSTHNGYSLHEGGGFDKGESTATIVLATGWRRETVLVLFLVGVRRLDVRGTMTYGGVDASFDENGFRIEFPDGGGFEAAGASYGFVAKNEGVMKESLPSPLLPGAIEGL